MPNEEKETRKQVNEEAMNKRMREKECKETKNWAGKIKEEKILRHKENKLFMLISYIE